ncbi:MAG: OOP-family protein, partial [Alphaproteobacteria bacterium]|nr:OOP-family protein [Alphaproteobacteria bacterium]
MKLRMLAMATVAAAALSTPAMAGQGWYLGLGGGYDSQQNFNVQSVTLPAYGTNAIAKDSAIGVVSFGYAWTGGWRLENEIGFTSHDVSFAGLPGNNSVTTDMVNILYDIPLSDTWKLSLGGGAGIGASRFHINTNPYSALDVMKGSTTSFQWQAIAGLSVAISPDVDLFGEYRYRSNETDSNFGSSYTQISPLHVNNVTENVAMLGLRWYLTPPAPP